MQSHFHYVPILKLKLGEVRALEKLTDNQEYITPLFEIPPIPWDYEEDKPSKGIDDHLKKTPNNIKKCWASQPFFIDFRYISEEIREESCPITATYDKLLEDNLQPTPVLILNMDSTYESCIIKLAQKSNKLCIRLEDSDFDRDGYDQDLFTLVNNAGLSPAQVDIIIDLGRIPTNGLTPFLVGLKNIISFFPQVSQWKTFTVAATAFPESMSNFKPLTASQTPRAEWHLWRKLLEAGLERQPAFGDFGIAVPEPFEMDPRMMRLGAKIKYTLDRDWLIVKGIGISRGGYKQLHRLAAHIANSKEFYGQDFSWGDDYIYKCAKGECSPGNQATWVSVGMNHHFAVVTDQLAKLADF